MADLVTGEGVALDLQLAKLASRSLAFAIDVAVQFATLLVCYLIFLSGPGQDIALVTAVMLVISVLVLVGYPVLFETLSKGRTLGKLALGLRVVRDDGGPIRFRHALVRGLAGFFVDFWALGLGGFVAMMVSLSSVKGKRVGDFLAGTVVIRQRVPDQRLDAVAMPTQLRAWAAEVDVDALSDELALAVRQYLGRMRSLNLEVAHDLGARLAEQVAGQIGAPMPPHVGTESYLSAVLTERREREHARASRRNTDAGTVFLPDFAPGPGSTRHSDRPPGFPNASLGTSDAPKDALGTTDEQQNSARGPFAPPS